VFLAEGERRDGDLLVAVGEGSPGESSGSSTSQGLDWSESREALTLDTEFKKPKNLQSRSI
jgi:hypothetical protein